MFIKGKGKAPTVNMVTTEVQQVTTWSKTKQSEWETKEATRKVAKEWVGKSSKNNVDRIFMKVRK